MSTGNSRSGRQTGSDDRGGIGVRIDAQKARASVEGVRKVACPLFFLPDAVFSPGSTRLATGRGVMVK
jgi:hypothetical protein